MDQLKGILKILQKHHFWLLCVLTMIAGVTGWFMARKSLSADFEKNKGSILGKFTAIQGILSTENHPNETWTTEIGKLTKQEKEIVRGAWDSVYNEQKKHLEWPPELGEEFLSFIQSHPPDAEIPRDLRGIYQDRIVRSEFPRLLAIVDAEAYGGSKTAPNSAKKDAPAAPAAHEYKVTWDSASQQDVEKLLYFPTVPSSAEVRQAQEDIWIYKALLNVIKDMNEGTYFAKVRRISEISIGARAAVEFRAGMSGSRIERLKAAAAPAAADGGAAAVASPAEGEAVAKAIDENRYVDPDGKPLPSGAAALLQFKRMPIYMKLTIDQREINKLLVECANAPLPVEVRQLRINPSKGEGSSSGSAKKNTSGGQAATAAPMTESEIFEVPIELAGIIYIYNPPDVAKLGAAPADAAAAPAGGTPAPAVVPAVVPMPPAAGAP
jgi:hypothetical protein